MKNTKGSIALESKVDEVIFTQSGLSCHVDRFISPFTEMTVTVSLPRRDGDREQISCTCAVIKCSREGKNEYHLLLYFLDIDEESSRKLASYCSTPQAH